MALTLIYIRCGPQYLSKHNVHQRKPIVNESAHAPSVCLPPPPHLRSNNVDVGRRLELPSKASAIDLMRPDLLLFRALGRSLVLWDSIEPTHAWLIAQMPNVGDIVI